MVETKISNHLRAAVALHGTIINLRSQVKEIKPKEYKNRPPVKELYDGGRDEEMFEYYAASALNGEISEPNDLYLLVRAYLRNRQADDAMAVMSTNLEEVHLFRNLLYEYILLCSKNGDFQAMNEAMGVCDRLYEIRGVHAKVLQALIHARVSEERINSYIQKMQLRFQGNASYEIVRAGFNTSSWDLVLQHIDELPKSPKARFLGLRALFRSGEREKALVSISGMNPADYQSSQVLEVIRIGLQLGNEQLLNPWFLVSSLSETEIQIELARSQYKSALEEMNFEQGFQAFKQLYKSEPFTSHQILKLIRTTKGEVGKAILSLYEISDADVRILSSVIEYGDKYNLKELADMAFHRLEAMALCADRNSDISKYYIDAAWSTANLRYLSSVFNNLEHIQSKGPEIHTFAEDYANLTKVLGLPLAQDEFAGGELVEVLILSNLIETQLPNEPYTPQHNHALVVNNSLKFGGAERQVVRCLSSKNFTKSLVIWNSLVNTNTNSFIPEVRKMNLKIHDYSIPKSPNEDIYTADIENLLSQIPHTPPLNPNITNKIRNLISIILDERPASLHLWQDTTSVLGAIAGLIAGTPRIIMSARSLPPYALSDSSFPDKGPNYYFNNRYVRSLYQILLRHDNVFLCHNSQNGKDKYVEWLGGFEEKMPILRNGFVLSDFNNKKRLKNKKQTLGTVFRFVDVKQPLLWLDAASELHKIMGDNIRFELAGDGPLLQRSIQYAKDLGISKQVDFLGYRSDVVEVLSGFDAFLLTSSIEGLPNVLIEAQAMGVPVISTDAGGASETFIDGVSGILVRDASAKNIAQAAYEVLSEDKFLEEGPSRARAHADKYFSLETMHRDLKEILFGVIK